MQAPANMHYGASHAKNNQTHEDEKHLELIGKTTVFHREKHLRESLEVWESQDTEQRAVCHFNVHLVH